MTSVSGTATKRRRSAMLAAGLLVSALLPLANVVSPASADEFYNGFRLWQPNKDVRNGQWGGFYLISPPPLAYEAPYTGTPSKYPPPVFYGPHIGTTLPEAGIGTP